MKRYILAGILAASLLATGCGKFVRDELITMQSEIDYLTKQIEDINKGVTSLCEVVNQMANKGFVTDVQTIEDEERGGYILKFRTVYLNADGTFLSDDTYELRLYSGVDGKDGADAEPFVLSARPDEDGRWYWYDIQAGDWMYDLEGNRLVVDGRDGEPGKTPKLDVKDGYWIISWDGGDNWNETEWRAKGDTAQEVFTGAEIFDDHIDLTLAADSTVISLARYMALEVSLAVDTTAVGDTLAIAPGDTLSIAYTVTGTGAETAMVVAGTDGRFKTALRRTSATEGFVDVICPAVFPEGGYIYVTVNGGNGLSIVRVINFIKRESEEEGV